MQLYLTHVRLTKTIVSNSNCTALALFLTLSSILFVMSLCGFSGKRILPIPIVFEERFIISFEWFCYSFINSLLACLATLMSSYFHVLDTAGFFETSLYVKLYR